MNSELSQCRQRLLDLVLAAGATACGIAPAEPLPPHDVEAYDRWIARGCHGSMAYLERYHEVRANPALLLEGARSVIVAAFPYSPVNPQAPEAPRIARYVLGADYHTVLRSRLTPVAEAIESMGHKARITVDTAPLRERLLAVRAGVGFIGRNGMLIVSGRGSYHFLAEVITTLPLEPSEPCRQGCADCGRCVKACPGRALGDDGVDARRCLSYLTIECRDDALPCALGGRLYGCDTCQEVCPHNRGPLPEPLPEFEPRPELTALTAEAIAALTPATYRRLTRDSAISRARLPMLLRNLRH